MKKKIVLFVQMSLLLSLFVTSCQKTESPVSSAIETSSSIPLPPMTDYKILDHGVSEYVVAMPSSPSERETTAANELVYFFQKATGFTLPIKEASLIPTSDPVISLGINARSENYASLLDSLTLGSSSYYLKREEQSLYLFSQNNGDGEGILYGVYDFMEDSFGFRVYAEDEIDYQNVEEIPLRDYDKLLSPSFENRSLGYRSLMDDKNYLQRMRLLDQYDDPRWGIYGHSQITKFLPYDKYFKEHPNWYANGEESYYNGLVNGQLNWCAGEEMESEFAKNLITYIEEKPNAIYFHLAQEDNSNYCTCEDCEKAKKDYAYNNAGLQIVFINHIAAKIDAYLAEKKSTRTIKLVVFAYQGTIEPPVIKNADGTYSPFSEKVHLNDRIMVFFTPIGLDFSHPFEHENNAQYVEDLKGWKAIAEGKLLTYLYDVNFHAYFVNFNNFDTVEGMYQDLLANGVTYLYSQGAVDTVTPSFEEARIYVESRLMWDTSLHYQDLWNEFFDHYYKGASKSMKEYYNLTRNRESYFMSAVQTNLGGIYGAINSADMWPEDLLDSLGKTLDGALQDIASLEKNDPTLYLSLKNRIMREYLTVLYLKLTLYSDHYSSEEVASMKALFKYYTALWNIVRTVESGNLEGLDA
jgi:hypothetical protein